MLEMRPNCECCDLDLSAQDASVLICSFECTWCPDCASGFDGGRCPNCGGLLSPRPTRAVEKMAANPASIVRVFNPDCLSTREPVTVA